MAQVMLHGSDVGGNDADTVRKFFEVATEASYAGDPLRVVSMLTETAGAAIKNDRVLYAANFFLAIVLIYFTGRRMWRLLS